MGLKQSLLYRELTGEELSDIVMRHFATNEFTAKLLDGGMFNTTYRVDVNGESYVFRMGPVNRHLILPFERSLMPGEVEFYRLCREAGLPVSEVVALDTARDIVDRDYMIVRYVSNTGMFELERDGSDWNAVMENVGRFMARMHEITGPRFGRLADVTAGRGFSKWSEYIFSELDAVTNAYLTVSDQYTKAELDEIGEFFHRREALLDEITVPRLNHVDVWDGNVLVRPDGSNEIAAIIDGDRSLWGDIDFDLDKRWIQNPEFERGYGRPLTADAHRAARRTLYRLLMLMIDGYVWKHEYQMPENSQQCHDEAMETLRQPN